MRLRKLQTCETEVRKGNHEFRPIRSLSGRSCGCRKRHPGVQPRIGLRDAASIPVSRSWKPAGSGQDFGSINSHYRALAESKQTFDRTSFGTPRTGSEGIYHWRVGSFASVDEIGREARSHSCQTPIQASLGAEGSAEVDDGPPRVGIADVCTIGSMHPCSRPAIPARWRGSRD